MDNAVRLRRWERGVKLETTAADCGFAYFWFYEWNLFDAVRLGEHTPGSWSWDWTVNAHGLVARTKGDIFNLSVEATPDGAELMLDVQNITGHDWPELAAIIPCYNPGDPEKPELINPSFLDGEHTHTYFYGRHGLELIAEEYPRAIHFSHTHWPSLISWQAPEMNRKFVFSEKWPTSDRDAYKGVMIRESLDKQWVMGIAWDSFLSAQGHNPWNCMHLSVRLGPLKIGEKKKVRGRIYLLEGSKEDCLRCYERDFNVTPGVSQ
jgi:hypothetical protein